MRYHGQMEKPPIQKTDIVDQEIIKIVGRQAVFDIDQKELLIKGVGAGNLPKSDDAIDLCARNHIDIIEYGRRFISATKIVEQMYREVHDVIAMHNPTDR